MGFALHITWVLPCLGLAPSPLYHEFCLGLFRCIEGLVLHLLPFICIIMGYTWLGSCLLYHGVCLAWVFLLVSWILPCICCLSYHGFCLAWVFLLVSRILPCICCLSYCYMRGLTGS
uniref:Uncharacterized protein n=1 Tax=Cacopsylla melanoneura TaxID=428564 RepID=A0A8D8ZBF3_9HEMI